MKYLLLVLLLLLTLSCSSSETPTSSIEGEITLDSISLHLNEKGEPGWLLEDMNKDGVVNVLDIIIFTQGVK